MNDFKFKSNILHVEKVSIKNLIKKFGTPFYCYSANTIIKKFNEFKKLNNTYKKFGFPFILAVKEKTKIEILNNFRKRVFSDPEIEFDEAVKQVKQIASLRLKELNNKDL